MLKFTVLAATAACALATAAQAQESTFTPTANWTGPYVGLNLGYGMDDDRFAAINGYTAGNFAAMQNEVRPSYLGTNREGGVAGLQAGFNYQFGNAVVGAEADYSALRSQGNTTYASPRASLGLAAGQRTTASHDLNNLATVRARAGLAMGRMMPYLTAGWAYGRLKDTAVFRDNTGGVVSYAGANKYNASGFVVGAGAEYAFGGEGWASHTSLRTEALYYDLGAKTLYAARTGVPDGAYALSFDTKGAIVRAGLNYRF